MSAWMEAEAFATSEPEAWQVIGSVVQRCEWMEAQLEADADAPE